MFIFFFKRLIISHILRAQKQKQGQWGAIWPQAFLLGADKKLRALDADVLSFCLFILCSSFLKDVFD